MKKYSYVKIDNEIMKLSSLDKILFPSSGFTKGDLINYYREISNVVLPHLRDRPFTLKRYPNGVESEYFFEKQCPSYRPQWMKTAEFKDVHFCVVNDLKSLVWTSNLAAIELHTTLAQTPEMQIPGYIAFDLDPGEGTDIVHCADVALKLKDLLEEMGLESFPKVSGLKGLHVYVPLNDGTPYSVTTDFARSCAERLERRFPEIVTSRMLKRYRPGKVFIDWSQNVDFKTTVCVYSLRAGEHPTVSAPLLWSEVHSAHKTSLVFGPAAVFKRLDRWGDLFEPVLHLQQHLSIRRAA